MYLYSLLIETKWNVNYVVINFVIFDRSLRQILLINEYFSPLILFFFFSVASKAVECARKLYCITHALTILQLLAIVDYYMSMVINDNYY